MIVVVCTKQTLSVDGGVIDDEAKTYDDRRPRDRVRACDGNQYGASGEQRASTAAPRGRPPSLPVVVMMIVVIVVAVIVAVIVVIVVVIGQGQGGDQHRSRQAKND